MSYYSDIFISALLYPEILSHFNQGNSFGIKSDRGDVTIFI
jgi:hypothetical protein